MSARTKAKAAKPAARRGRPPIDNPATKRLSVRVTPDQHAHYASAAEAAGLTITGWIEKLLDRASKREA